MLLNQILKLNTRVYIPRYDQSLNNLYTLTDKTYITCKQKALTQNLFKQGINVLQIKGENSFSELKISNSFSGFVLSKNFSNKKEWNHDMNCVSCSKGLAFFELKEDILIPNSYDEFILECFDIGLVPMDIVVYEDTKFILAYRVTNEILVRAKKELSKYTPLFFQEPKILNETTIYEIVKKSYLKTGKDPIHFKEKEIPTYKIEYLFNQVDNLISIKDEKVKIDTFIQYPNKEQIAILLASGRVNKRISLNDGREIIFKGTDQEIEREYPIYDFYNEIEAVREVRVRETVVFGLDVNKFEYIRFE